MYYSTSSLRAFLFTAMPGGWGLPRFTTHSWTTAVRMSVSGRRSTVLVRGTDLFQEVCARFLLRFKQATFWPQACSVNPRDCSRLHSLSATQRPPHPPPHTQIIHDHRNNHHSRGQRSPQPISFHIMPPLTVSDSRSARSGRKPGSDMPEWHRWVWG